MATKITKAQNFATIREILVDANRPELVEFIDHELELIANKAAKRSATPTKAQKVGAELRAAILDTLQATGEPMTISAIIAALDWAEPLTSQKVSAQLTKLIGENRVEKTVENRVNFYKAV